MLFLSRSQELAAALNDDFVMRSLALSNDASMCNIPTDSYFFLVSALASPSTPILIPARLSGPTKGLAAFRRRNIAPSCSAETNGLPLYGRRRELSTRHVQYLESQVDEDLRRKSGLSHNPPQYSGSPHAQCTREFRRNTRLSRL